MFVSRCRSTSILCGLLILGPVAAAVADFKDLLGRIPGDANAVMVVNIEKIMQSPMAQREGWQDRRVSNFANKPLIVPPSATRLVLAALIRPGDLEPVWEVSVMDLNKEPSVERINQWEGGYLDKFDDKIAAWSPIDAYFVLLDNRVLGAVTPANRQFVARWARQKQALAGAFVSTYLRTATTAVDKGTEIVIAMDFQDWLSVPTVERRLKEVSFTSLADQQIDPQTLAEVLAGIRGLTLTINIDEKAHGKGVVDFAGDASAISAVAKPLMLEILGKAGAYLSDLESWNFEVKRNRLTLEGTLSSEGLRQIFSLAQPPSPIESPIGADDAELVTHETPPGDEPAREALSPQAKMAAASQEYFAAVSKILDRREKAMGSGSQSAGLSTAAKWLRTDARFIERLPILDVDPELVAWGLQINSQLLEIANIFGVGGHQTRARASSVHATYEDSGSGYGYDHDAVGRASVARMNRSAQRRELVAEEKAAAIESAGSIWRDAVNSRAEIRAMMTARYGVEF